MVEKQLGKMVFCVNQVALIMYMHKRGGGTFGLTNAIYHILAKESAHFDNEQTGQSQINKKSRQNNKAT